MAFQPARLSAADQFTVQRHLAAAEAAVVALLFQVEELAATPIWVQALVRAHAVLPFTHLAPT